MDLTVGQTLESVRFNPEQRAADLGRSHEPTPGTIRVGSCGLGDRFLHNLTYNLAAAFESTNLERPRI